MNKPTPSISINNASQVLQLPENDLPYLRHNRAQEITLEPGGLSANQGIFTSLESDSTAELQIDATGCAVVPGLIDSHTHLPFVGWRANEYALKIAGRTYEEISTAGGGIAASARAFEQASDSEILAQSENLAQEMLKHGTTTFECKSGYGLSIENERRALKLAQKLGENIPQQTVSTALLAHAIPPGSTSENWLDEVSEAIPQISNETQINSLDIFVETMAFSNEDLVRMGELAAQYKLNLRCHVEQFTTHRSVPVAISAGARSVDHLACMHADDIPILAQSECAAVFLPGAEFLGEEREARARELADDGAICALATDLNPGTSPITSLPLIIGLAIRRYRWTIQEALLAVTLNSAWVLGLHKEVGSIEQHKRADFLLLDSTVESIPYRLGHNPVVACFIAGYPVFVRQDAQFRFSKR